MKRAAVQCQVFFFMLFLAVSPTLPAQHVRQWLFTGSGSFTGMGYENNLASADSLHYACAGGNGDLALSVFLSDDGGLSWRAALTQMKWNIDSLYQPQPGNWDTRLYSSVARPSADLLLLCGSYEHRDNRNWYPFLLRSEDRGEHWSEVHLADSLPPNYAPMLVMQDAERGVMTGMQYIADSAAAVPALLTTTDGGLSWTARPLPDPYIRQLLLPGMNKVFLSTSSVMHVSTDFGQSWQTQHELPPNTNVLGTHDGTLLWAAAGPGTGTGDLKRDILYRSDDDGASWTKLYEGDIYPNFGINAMDFSDAHNGIAVGQWGRILRTTDGGSSWSKEYEPYDLYDPSIGAVCYPSSHTAVALTMTGIVTLTGDDVLRPPLLTVEQGNPGLHRQAHWTAIDGASAYILQLAEDAPDPYLKHEIFETSKLKRTWQTPDTVMELTAELLVDRDYFVRVRAIDDGSGSDWSRLVKFCTVGTTSMESPTTSNGVSLHLYPHPAHDHVGVRLAGDHFKGLCELRDQLGRLVRTIDAAPVHSSADGTASVLRIDTRDLSNGMYFLIAPTSTGLQIARIIVRK